MSTHLRKSETNLIISKRLRHIEGLLGKPNLYGEKHALMLIQSLCTHDKHEQSITLMWPIQLTTINLTFFS